jgi:hypothetical protein
MMPGYRLRPRRSWLDTQSPWMIARIAVRGVLVVLVTIQLPKPTMSI